MKDSVTFHCAFEDDEGPYVDPKELSEDDAIAEAVKRNKAERDRLKGIREPDAIWFVVEATTSYRVVARPEPKPKKIVRRRKK